MGRVQTIGHLLAVQKIFGRGRRWRFCGVKGSFGPSVSRFGQLEGPLHFRSMAASSSTLERGVEFVPLYCEEGCRLGPIILRGGMQAGATLILLEKRTSRTCGGSSLREDVPPVGLVDQNGQMSEPCRLAAAFHSSFRGVCKVNGGEVRSQTNAVWELGQTRCPVKGQTSFLWRQKVGSFRRPGLRL